MVVRNASNPRERDGGHNAVDQPAQPAQRSCVRVEPNGLRLCCVPPAPAPVPAHRGLGQAWARAGPGFRRHWEPGTLDLASQTFSVPKLDFKTPNGNIFVSLSTEFHAGSCRIGPGVISSFFCLDHLFWTPCPKYPGGNSDSGFTAKPSCVSNSRHTTPTPYHGPVIPTPPPYQ